MSSSSQSNNEAQSSRQTPQQASRAESRSSSRSALNHSNARRHRASRGAPYAPPLQGLQANPDQTQGLADGPARPAHLPGHAQDSPVRRLVGTTTNYGGPRGGVNRPWPLSIVPFEVDEEHLSENFTDNMGRTYDLRAPYTEFAEELIQIPRPQQYAILLYSILSVRQSVELLIHSQDMALLATPTAASLSVQARLFSYSRHLWAFVQNRAKEILMDPFLEVYSCDPIQDGPPAGRSLLEQDHVRIQSNKFKQDYLPAGYMDRDPAAVASVNSKLRDRLKHERGAMRNLLLSMVHSPSGQPLTHPVPTLTKLIIDMQSRMLPNSKGDLHTNTRVRACIAYLRIQKISHYARWVPGDINRQWALIDKQLQDL
ncbi:hypothetical protein PtA15_9A280 [Puccinia triticina]|uniref:Uncharacterized protein n=1 Tax=Puccinia triticina TaxID=208348 RepID=A0ABY7CU15_9BASI|nr:uncharacterized protein PtA15_9A280 [Puccinia triticina]WAQ88155.1 hypothetical protein PtA15_9A280 [Puccinia triticina]